MSSIVPLLIFGLMSAPALMYFLLRISVPETKYNSLLIFGLMTILGEVAAFVWMCIIYLQGGVIGLELYDVTPFLWIPVVISLVTIYDLQKTLKSMKELQQK